MRPLMRLTRGFLWTAAGNATAQLLALAGGIVAARFLGKGGFGELALIRSTVLMLAIFAGSGLGVTVTKYVAELRDAQPERCGQVIALVAKIGVSLAILLVAAAVIGGPRLAAYISASKDFGVTLQIGMFLVLPYLLSGIQHGVLTGLEAFRQLSFLVAIEALITLAGTAVGAMRGDLRECLIGILVAAVLNLVLRTLVAYSVMRKRAIKLDWRGPSRDYRLIWKFALPTILVGMMVWPFEWLARLPIALAPRGMDELGAFTAAYSWGVMVLFLPNQIAGAALPILSNLYANGDRRGFLRSAIHMYGLALLAGVTVALPLAAGSSLIMGAYGRGFADASGVLLTLLGAYAIASASVLGTIFAACGRMWWQVIHYGVWGVTLSATAYAWGASGAQGLAASYVTAYIVLVACQSLLALRVYGQIGLASDVLTRRNPPHS